MSWSTRDPRRTTTERDGPVTALAGVLTCGEGAALADAKLGPGVGLVLLTAASRAAFAAPRGSGPATGREASHGSIPSRSQTRVVATTAAREEIRASR